MSARASEKASGTRLAAGALGAVLACAAVYGVGLATPATHPIAQGDELGREQGESFDGYRQRAEPGLSESADPAFALVTFPTPLSPEDAAREVAPAERVSGLLLVDAPIKPIPEPTFGHTRAEVFATEASHEAAIGETNGVALDPNAIGAVVVYADGDELREIAAGSGAVVEVLPSDAAWGAFAVNPIHPR